MNYDKPIFHKRQSYWGYVLIIFLAFCYVGHAEKEEYELRKALKYCRESQEFNAKQNLMVWDFKDSKCFEQLKNSNEAIIRIQYKK